MKPQPSGHAKSGSTTGIRILIGCGVAGLICVILACGGVFLAARWGINQINEIAKPFEEKGYQRRGGQVVVVSNRIEQPTVYVCQVVKFTGASESHVAMICQVAEIEGEINGDIDFYGQVLKIGSKAIVKGDIRVQGAQVVEVNGKVHGKITGKWQVIKGPGAPAPPKTDEGKAAPNDKASPSLEATP